MGMPAKWLTIGPGKEELDGISITQAFFKKMCESVINSLAPLQA